MQAEGSAAFAAATVIAKYGDGPWGDVLTSSPGKTASTSPAEVMDPAALQVPAGFKVELLYKAVPKEEQGSWVSMTVDPKGGQSETSTVACTALQFRRSVILKGRKLSPLSNVGGAHGLLYAFDSLYVMVNEKPEKGLWRLRDTDGDDQFDKADHLRKFDGSGEHGPHSIVLSPDKKSIYFANGNPPKPPVPLEKSRSVSWDEDHLLPRMWDANGHARGFSHRAEPSTKRIRMARRSN